jgi:rubrerythrin
LRILDCGLQIEISDAPHIFNPKSAFRNLIHSTTPITFITDISKKEATLYEWEKTMPLENFGSILNFAEELELQDLGFYKTVAENPACADHKHMFEEFAAAINKNVKSVQRTRRENVTEMILEPIKDFIRAPFCEECEGADSMGASEAVDAARRLEERAVRYYTEAAAKIKAQPEVARALKTVGKKHTAHLNKLKEM